MISSRCLNTVLIGGARQNSRLSAKIHLHFDNLLSATGTSSSSLIEQNNKRKMSSKVLTLDSMNPNIIKMEYVVRGPLIIRAGEIENEIRQVKYNAKV